ncbi:MAG: hypothetical protein JSV17_01670 [Candidatus Aminicenantes bacterium]|nr:MAG: hypothetical protein JSV17_01670 [Candidatus Aminicenantes bacterium]
MKREKFKGLFVVFLIFVSAFLLNCSSPTAPETPSEEQPIANPSFAQDIQAAILNGSCALGGCHDGTASGGLNLTQGNAYNNLVNVNSTQDATKNRVLPNDADNSYLVIKIEGRQSVGERMPLNRSPLSATKIQNIKNWINNGANNN